MSVLYSGFVTHQHTSTPHKVLIIFRVPYNRHATVSSKQKLAKCCGYVFFYSVMSLCYTQDNNTFNCSKHTRYSKLCTLHLYSTFCMIFKIYGDLFPHTALLDWSLLRRREVIPLKVFIRPSVCAPVLLHVHFFYIHHRHLFQPFIAQWFFFSAASFNIQKFYILTTECISVFYMDLRKKIQRLFPYTT